VSNQIEEMKNVPKPNRAPKHTTQKYSITEKHIQPWIDQHESIKIYLQRLNGNKTRIGLYLYRYCEWAGKTPEQLLELKTSYDNSDAERLLDRFTITDKFPESTKFTMINSVKAFYRTNYKQLQTAAGKFEYATLKCQGVLPKDQRLKLYLACYTPRDRALIMTAMCTAIARETISLMCWNHFEEDWMQQEIPCLTLPSNIVKGHGKGKYKGVQQVTFLTPEAKHELLAYRTWYQKTFKHNWLPNEHIFLSVKDNLHEPLTKEGLARVMIHLTQRADIKFGIHSGRMIVQTALENVGVSPNWVRKIKGRKVKGEESPYSKPAKEQLRKKYKEALPDLEFLTTYDAPKDPQQQFLSEFAELLQKHPEKFEKFEQFILKL
jgi:hypothetical protein